MHPHPPLHLSLSSSLTCLWRCTRSLMGTRWATQAGDGGVLGRLPTPNLTLTLALFQTLTLALALTLTLTLTLALALALTLTLILILILILTLALPLGRSMDERTSSSGQR